MPMLLLENKKKSKLNTIQLWWEYINKLEDQELEVCQEDSQVVDSQELELVLEQVHKMLELKTLTDDSI